MERILKGTVGIFAALLGNLRLNEESDDETDGGVVLPPASPPEADDNVSHAHGPNAAEMPPRCRRDTTEIPPRYHRDGAEMPPRSHPPSALTLAFAPSRLPGSS